MSVCLIVCMPNVKGTDILKIAIQCNRNKWRYAKCTHVYSVSKQNYRPNNNS